LDEAGIDLGVQLSTTLLKRPGAPRTVPPTSDQEAEHDSHPRTEGALGGRLVTAHPPTLKSPALLSASRAAGLIALGAVVYAIARPEGRDSEAEVAVAVVGTLRWAVVMNEAHRYRPRLRASTRRSLPDGYRPARTLVVAAVTVLTAAAACAAMLVFLPSYGRFAGTFTAAVGAADLVVVAWQVRHAERVYQDVDSGAMYRVPATASREDGSGG